MATLFTLPQQVPVSSGGVPYAGAKLYFYQAGTLIAQTVYTDINNTVAHAQPVVADSNGRFAAIYFNEGASHNYRIQLKTSADVLIYDQDNIPAVNASSYFVSVTDYGADPTGVSNSTTAFANAAAASLTVLIPAGTYKLSAGTLAFSTAVRFVGSGRNNTFLNCTSGSSNLFAWTGNTNSGGGIEQVTINGSGMTGGNLLSNVGQGRWTVSDVQLLNGYNGIYVEDQNFTVLRNVFMNGQTGAYSIKNYGTGVAAAAVLSIESCAIGYASCTAGSPVGLLLDGDCATIDVRYLSVVNGYRGVSIVNTPNFAYGPQFLTAYDLQVDQSYEDGIHIDGGSGVTGSHRFTDLYQHYSHTSHGIYISSSATDCSFQSGVVITNYKNGIYNNGKYSKFVDLQISKNSQAGVGTYPGVQFAANSIGSSMIGCLSGTWTGSSTADTNYGVLIDIGATSYTVVANNLNGNTAGPYLNSAADTSSTIFANSQPSSSPNIISVPIVSANGQNMILRCATNMQVVLGDSTNGTSFASNALANAVNNLIAYGTATGVSPVLQSTGTDTDLNLNLKAKGAGVLQAGVSGMWAANGSVATALSSVGPTGSHATVQEWLLFKNAAGTTRYIPAF